MTKPMVRKTENETEELLIRAMAAWLKSCAKDGAMKVQPSWHLSGLVEDDEGLEYIVLSNANGKLAIYRVRPNGLLKRLRRWPEELN